MKWGASRWFFETNDQGQVIRQVEAYDHGPTLRYDREHVEDALGHLSEKPLDLDEFGEFETDAETFASAWSQWLHPNSILVFGGPLLGDPDRHADAHATGGYPAPKPREANEPVCPYPTAISQPVRRAPVGAHAL